MIDRKFKFVATNPCKNSVYTEENAVVFCAKDKAVPSMLTAYIKECEKIGCGDEHLEAIRLMRGRIIQYQIENESRIPDTETDCEIDRCIGGNV